MNDGWMEGYSRLFRGPVCVFLYPEGLVVVWRPSLHEQEHTHTHRVTHTRARATSAPAAVKSHDPENKPSIGCSSLS